MRPGESLSRFTPGFTLSPTDSTKLELLCRRKAFSEFGKLIELLDVSFEKAADLLIRVNNIEDFLHRLSIPFYLDSRPELGMTRRATTVSDDFTDLRKHPFRKGLITLTLNGEIHFFEGAKCILAEQFHELRDQLQSGSRSGKSLEQ